MTSFSVSATRLTGSELLEAVRLMTDKATRSEMCQICGYYTEEGNNTKLHFTDFYMAILEAKKDVIVDDEESAIVAENSDNQEAIDERWRITPPMQSVPLLNTSERIVSQTFLTLIKVKCQALSLLSSWSLIVIRWIFLPSFLLIGRILGITCATIMQSRTVSSSAPTSDQLGHWTTFVSSCPVTDYCKQSNQTKPDDHLHSEPADDR